MTDDRKAERAIIDWLLDDAGRTRANLRKLHERKMLTPAQTADWETLIELKCGIADAIERGEHLPKEQRND